jgi:predicted ATPase
MTTPSNLPAELSSFVGREPQLAELLDQTIAAACGIIEKRERPVIEVLVEGLAGRRSLLVLDGCEHLVDPHLVRMRAVVPLS